MDDYPEVEHINECIWVNKKIKKTKRWWIFMGLKKCPTCNSGVNI